MEERQIDSKKFSVARDPSTLSSLAPAQPRDVTYRSFRSSARMQGSHLMLLRRPSRVAEAAREYVAGDPVQLLDWKAYARTDQLIIRERRDEATARILIGFDVSATMVWPAQHLQQSTIERLPPTKAEIATRVALHVAHTHLKRGDMVDLRVCSADAATSLLKTSLRSPSDAQALFARLERAGFACEAYEREFQVKGPVQNSHGYAADVCLWIGDTLGTTDFMSFLELGRRQVLLHVLSSLECDVTWIKSNIAYFDVGRELTKEYQGQQLLHADHYLAGLRRWCARLEVELRRRGAAYIELTDKTPIATYQRALQVLGMITQ